MKCPDCGHEIGDRSKPCPRCGCRAWGPQSPNENEGPDDGFVDYYAILGVPPDATVAQLARAYREAALKDHPDHGGSHERMVQVNEAWLVLSDSTARHDYDQVRTQRACAKARAAWKGKAEDVRRRAQEYPRQWAPFEQWINRFVYDVKAAEYGVSDRYLFPTVRKSISGRVSLVLGAALGVVVEIIALKLVCNVSIEMIPKDGGSVYVLVYASVAFASCGAVIGVGIHRLLRYVLCQYQSRMRSTPASSGEHRQPREPQNSPGSQTSSAAGTEAAPNGTRSDNQGRVLLHCTACGQCLRVPAHNGELVITCPKCRNKFVYNGKTGARTQRKRRLWWLYPFVLVLMFLFAGYWGHKLGMEEVNRVNAYLAEGDYDRAIAECTKHLRRDKQSSLWHFCRGVAYREKRNYDEAIADFTEAIRLDPKLAAAYSNRGYAHSEKHDYDQAIADYNEAIRLDPKLAAAYKNRGYAHSEKHDYDQAIADYNEAIRLDPKLAAAYNFRGYAHYEKHDYDQAIADYNEAIRLDPRDVAAYNFRGYAHYEKHDYDQAIADYNEAIRLDPRDVAAYNFRGYAHYEKHDYDQAIADYNEAIRLDPRDVAAYNFRGYAYCGKHNYDQAIADLTEAIRLEPKCAEAYYARGAVYRIKGESDKAEADFAKAKKLGYSS